jgi:site-specific DNA-methyltransferase (adenine-specific)
MIPQPDQNPSPSWDAYKVAHPTTEIGQALLVHADCFDWLSRIPEASLHAIVTDPPYGVKEFETDQLEKRSNGHGGLWRIPPTFDGHTRAPLPRFTALNAREKEAVRQFFIRWAALTLRALRPGGHVFIASNTFMSQIVFEALVAGGLEYRGTIMRMVRTLRGGDRPKNFEDEFPDVCSLPRGCYEPWGLFRKPLPSKMTVGDCLRAYQTGGLRRRPDGNPFEDVIESARTPRTERDLADHPSLKPQAFLRQLVYAALPLGEGIIADPFMGSGSTVAAALALGLRCIGVERNPDYFALAQGAVKPLSLLYRSELPVTLQLF